MSEFWNSRFSAEEYFYGTDPNVYFKDTLNTLTPGKLWVPGAGEGRDAVYAATQGWQVDAFDLSSAGKEKAEKLATTMGVTVNYQLADAADIAPGNNYYDAIALVYFHLPSQLRSAFLKKCINALKPGGMIIIEAFEPKQLNNSSGGPKDIDMLCTADILAADLAGMTILQNEETTTILNEGDHHKGFANIVRLKGIKN